jgi:uncharacterized membrane protein YeiH
MNLILGFDIVGVFFFAMSGTLTARRYNKLDLFGLGFVGLITAVGGGTVRDIILNAHPIAWVSHSAYIIAIIAGYIIAVIFAKKITKLTRPFITLDALGVAFAAIAGLEKSLDYGSNWAAALMFAVISATVGGVIRDIICNEIPMVLRKDLYALAVFIGGGVYLAMLWLFPETNLVAEISAFVSIVLLRLLSVKYNWNVDIRALERRKKEVLRVSRKVRRKGKTKVHRTRKLG